jgi:hypothetical protein
MCSALWLPLLLVILAVVLAPVVDESSLGIYLLLLTVTATGVLDLVRTIRRDRRPPTSGGG